MSARVGYGRSTVVILVLVVAGFVAGSLLTPVAGLPPESAGEIGRGTGTPGAGGYTPHLPILIDGDAGFLPENGVTGGTGTQSDPYVIDGWEINASSATGISIRNTLAHAAIRNVSVSGGDWMYDGVLLDGVANVTVDGGRFVANGYGIVSYASSQITLINNVITNSLWEGILVESSSLVTVQGNDAQFNTVYGIDVYMSRDVEVRDNVASYGDFAGIYLANVDRVLLAGNNASSNSILGIGLDFAGNVTIVRNDLWDNDYGMDFLDSRDVLVRGNAIGYSGSDGVGVAGVENVTFDENLFLGNGGGLFASSATDLRVASNTFRDNGLAGGDDYGVRTAWDAGYPAGGNFWSDYPGVDNCSGPGQDVCTGGDGIGDTPYAVDPDSFDRYPLMAPRPRVQELERGPVLDPGAPPILGHPPRPISGAMRIQATVRSDMAVRRPEALPPSPFLPGPTLWSNGPSMVSRRGDPGVSGVGGNAARSLQEHPPIYIWGNDGFVPSNGVVSGSGAPEDPYVIEGWSINASEAEGSAGILIGLTDAYFVVRDVLVQDGLLSTKVGIQFSWAANGRIENATVTNNIDGIRLQGPPGNLQIVDSTIFANYRRGIRAMQVDGLAIERNHIRDNGLYGVQVLDSKNILIRGNRVSANGFPGVDLEFSSGATITGNLISENGFDGIHLATSTGVLVHGNALVDNELPQAMDIPGSGNAFDAGYPAGGNFWSDYAGVDNCSGPGQGVCTGGDGIGDTPHAIDGNAVDRYPLMSNPLSGIALRVGPTFRADIPASLGEARLPHGAAGVLLPTPSADVAAPYASTADPWRAPRL